MKTEFTISDAFKALSEIEDDIEVTSIPVKKRALKESSFSVDLRNGRAVEEAQEVMNEPAEPSEEVLEVIDADADAIEHLRDSVDYVGQVILQCKACKACKFVDMDKLVKAEVEDGDEEIYNVDDECPNCHVEGKGYVILGQVGKVDKESESEVTDEVTFDNEIKNDEAEPSLDNDLEKLDAEEEVEASEEVVEPEVDNEIEEEPEKEYDETDAEDDTLEIEDKFGEEVNEDETAEDDTDKKVKEDLDIEKIPGLRISTDEDEEPLEGSALLSSFKATFDQLVKLLGQPTKVINGEKMDHIWYFWYDDNFGYLYDWKEGEDPAVEADKEIKWNIGGKDKWHEGWADELAEAIEANLPLTEEAEDEVVEVEETTEEVPAEEEVEEVDEKVITSTIPGIMEFVLQEGDKPKKIKVVQNDKVVFKGVLGDLPEDLREIEIGEFESPKLIVDVDDEDGFTVDDFMRLFTDDEDVVISIMEDDEPICEGTKQEVLENCADKHVVMLEAPTTLTFVLRSEEEEETKEDTSDEEVEQVSIDDEEDLVEAIINKNNMDMNLIDTIFANEYWINESVERKEDLDIIYDNYILPVNDEMLTESFKRITGFKDEVDLAKEKLTHRKDRKDLAEGIQECKNNNRPYRVTKSTTEGYRYDLIESCNAKKKNQKFRLDEATSDEIKEITELGKVIGLETMVDLQNFYEREKEGDEKVIDTLRRYAAELSEPLNETVEEVVTEPVVEKVVTETNEETIVEEVEPVNEEVEEICELTEECDGDSTDTVCEECGKELKESWSDFDQFEDLTNEYLPNFGEGENKAQQAVTAVSKLVYKWFNDGDVYDNVHGLEGWMNDLSSYANWLAANIDGAKDILDQIENVNDGQGYEDILFDLCNLVLKEDVLEALATEAKVGTIYKCDGPYRWDDNWDPNKMEDDLYEALADEEEFPLTEKCEDSSCETVTEEVGDPDRLTRGEKAFLLGKVIESMNDESAYYGEWIELWPDETIVDIGDATSFFGDEEDFNELEDLFKKVYKKYHRSGLFRPSAEIEKVAHDYDKLLGLPTIKVIRETHVDEEFDSEQFDQEINEYFAENYEGTYIYNTEKGSVDSKGNIVLEGKITYSEEKPVETVTEDLNLTEEVSELKEADITFNLKPIKNTLKDKFAITVEQYRDLRNFLKDHPYAIDDKDIEDVKAEVCKDFFGKDYSDCDQDTAFAVHCAVEDYFDDLRNVRDGLIEEGFIRAFDEPKSYIVTNNLSEEKFTFTEAAKQAINE